MTTTMTMTTEKSKRLYAMTPEERVVRDATRTIHKKLRAPLRGGRSGDRYDLLAWAFVRGLPFRRCERSHRIQMCGAEPADRHGQVVLAGEAPFEHNLPSHRRISEKLAAAGVVATVQAIGAWLADPSGAVPAPKPRPKKPYQGEDKPSPVAKVA